MDLTPGVLFEYFKFIETTEMEVLGNQFSKEPDRLDLLNAYRQLAEVEIDKLTGDDYCLGQIGLDAKIASLYLQGGNFFEFEERITECRERTEQEGFARQSKLLDDALQHAMRNKP
jgi:hypothetical protein